MAISVVLPRRSPRTRAGAARSWWTSRAPPSADALARGGRASGPALTDRVLTEQGELRRHVNVFVGEESIRFLDGLATRVDDGATIMIVPAVSGG